MLIIGQNYIIEINYTQIEKIFSKNYYKVNISNYRCWVPSIVDILQRLYVELRSLCPFSPSISKMERFSSS